MPTIAVGLCNMAEVLAALHEEAARLGDVSRACRITPGLLAVREADLLRLRDRPRAGVHYDGRKLWVGGVDFTVQQ